MNPGVEDQEKRVSYELAYKLVQLWYLARLRTAAALSDRLELTPLAKINTDRRIVEQLVSEAAQQQTGITKQTPRTGVHSWGWVLLWITSAALIVGIMYPSLVQLPAAGAAGSVGVTALTCAVALYGARVIALRDQRSRSKSHIRDMAQRLCMQSIDFDENALRDGEAFEQELVEMVTASVVKERTLFEYAAAILLVADSQLRIVCSNNAIVRFLGYSPRELHGTSVSQFFVTEIGSLDDRIKENLTSNGFELEVIGLCKSGERKDFHLYGEWSTSEQLYFFECADISDRKELERTRQDLMNMVSHDLRSPLAAIQGVLCLTGSGAFGAIDENGQQMLSQAEADAERLMSLVNDLLDSEQARAGKLRLNLSLVRISTIVNSSIRAISYLAKEKEIAIVVQEIDADITINADSKRLAQVCINLLSNAIKFAPSKTTVRVVAGRCDDCVQVMVCDQGPGIPLEDQPNLFQKFFRSSSPPLSSQPGAGLGLSICKDIVEAHGGSIGVNSNEDNGATFWIKLPIGSYEEPHNRV